MGLESEYRGGERMNSIWPHSLLLYLNPRVIHSELENGAVERALKYLGLVRLEFKLLRVTGPQFPHLGKMIVVDLED